MSLLHKFSGHLAHSIVPPLFRREASLGLKEEGWEFEHSREGGGYTPRDGVTGKLSSPKWQESIFFDLVNTSAIRTSSIGGWAGTHL